MHNGRYWYEFSYIGEEETLDDDQNEDYEVRTVCVNNEQKKVCGNDVTWVKKINFNNPKAFEDSNVIEELREHYAVKRKRDYDYATVHNYVCKYSTGVNICRAKKKFE